MTTVLLVKAIAKFLRELAATGARVDEDACCARVVARVLLAALDAVVDRFVYLAAARKATTSDRNRTVSGRRVTREA
jgi:hypothetical protein